MDSPADPAADSPSQSPKPPVLNPAPTRARWAAHFLLLSAYPLILGALGYLLPEKESLPLLPQTKAGLLQMAGIELGIFLVVFLAACAASRPTFDQLYLRWRGGWRPLLRGAAYSIALRVGLAVILIAVILIVSSVTQIQKSTVEQLRPKIEAVVDPKALQRDPLYFALMITVISFVVAGFREELWRAGMLAGFRALFPAHYARRFGPASAVAFAAIVFGLGHAPQGISAIGLTMVLGIGLGAIILWHSSIWDAAIAHGFFDATTFLFLWILANYSHLLPA